MFCSQCGANAEDEVFCPQCKKQLKTVKLMKGPFVYNENAEALDVPKLVLIILAFFAPLFGFIFYVCGVSRAPVCARAYGISSLVGVAGSVFLTVIGLMIALL